MPDEPYTTLRTPCLFHLQKTAWETEFRELVGSVLSVQYLEAQEQPVV